MAAAGVAADGPRGEEGAGGLGERNSRCMRRRGCHMTKAVGGLERRGWGCDVRVRAARSRTKRERRRRHRWHACVLVRTHQLLYKPNGSGWCEPSDASGDVGGHSKPMAIWISYSMPTQLHVCTLRTGQRRRRQAYVQTGRTRETTDSIAVDCPTDTARCWPLNGHRTASWPTAAFRCMNVSGARRAAAGKSPRGRKRS